MKKIKIGSIKSKLCKITNKMIKMYYTGDFKSETGENGHKGWLCLHSGKVTA